jgi:hypothetical protein
LEKQEDEDALGGWDAEEGRKTAPWMAVEAGCLPKGAEVEWQCTWGIPGAPTEEEEEDEDEERSPGELRETWARSTTGAFFFPQYGVLFVLSPALLARAGDGASISRTKSEVADRFLFFLVVSNETSLPISWQCSQAFPSSSASSPAISVTAILGCSLCTSFLSSFPSFPH